jgi:hypothetical protein
MLAVRFESRRSRCAVPPSRPGDGRALLVAVAGWIALFGASPSTPQSSNVGLSSVRAQRFANEALPPYVPQQVDLFGLALAAGDFNDDGADDLATGIPRDDCMAGIGPVDCGSVVIRYGVPGVGLASGLADQILNQQEIGSLDPAEEGDFFGWALAACDFDADGFDDLAVGVPKEDLLLGGTVTIEDSGIVEIYSGSRGGLISPASAVLKSNGIQSVRQLLGWALACGRFDSAIFADLVVGVPGATVNNLVGAGRIRFYPGSLAGLGAGVISIDQDSADMAGVAEAGDAFGEALAIGSFDINGIPDLAIGVPGENEAAGAVQVISGGVGGINTDFNFIFLEDALGGVPEAGDQFGHALAMGDFDHDGRDDIAIGVPLEDLGFAEETGNVGIVYGQSSFFPPFLRSQGFDQDAILGAGNTESDDLFGFALASGDFDRDGYDDLAIGHPQEDNAGASDGDRDGSVTVIMGAPAVGLSPARRRHLAAAHDGTPGDLGEHAEFFGRALGVGDFDGNGHADLVVGVPKDDEDGLFDVGSEVVLYGSLFADGFESGELDAWSDVEPQS